MGRVLTQHLACDLCSKRKRRCDGNGLDPCVFCQKRGAKCTYSPRGKRGPKRKQLVDSDDASLPAGINGENLSSSGSENRVDDNKVIRPISKIFRLSPSEATGLLGFEENNYLQTYFNTYNGINCVPLQSLQRSILQFDFQNSAHMENHIFNDKLLNSTSADRCTLWATIAYGAHLQGIKNKSIIERYLYNARESIKEVYDEATSDVLSSYLMLAKIYASLEAYPLFTRYLGFASVIAQVIGKSHYLASMKSNYNGTAAEKSIMPLNEDLWFILEALSVLKTFLAERASQPVNITEGNISGKSPQETPFCFQDIVGSVNEKTAFHGAFTCFAPNIEGLPNSQPEIVEALLEEGGCMLGHQAKQLVRNNIVSAALTSLADPNATAISSLVNVATKEKTSLLPVVMSINYRVAQVMHLVVTKSTQIARISGAKLELVVDRILKEFDPSFIARGGVLPHKLCSILIFLKLLSGNEEACLSYLLSGLTMARSFSGLLRFPGWRQDVTWFAGLLKTAELQVQYNELASIYNGMELGGGFDVLPNYDDEAAETWHCRGIAGKAIYKILKENMQNGTARIFNNLPFSGPNHSHCKYIQSELFNKIELDLMPSLIPASDYSSAIESPLDDFIYCTDDTVKNEDTIVESEAFLGEFNPENQEDLEMLNILASGFESSNEDLDNNVYSEMWHAFDQEPEHFVQDDGVLSLGRMSYSSDNV